MVSVAIRPFASKWPSALKFSDGLRVPVNFEALITVYNQLSSFFRSESGVSIISFILYSASTFIAITVPAWIFLYSDRKKKINKPIIPADEVNEESPEGMPLEPRDENESSRVILGELVTTDDVAYAEEIQFHGTLLALIFTSEIPYNPSSSLQEPIIDNETAKVDNEVENLPQKNFCEICLVNKDSWQMFTNDKCSHSFCYECTSGHITTKIQEKLKEIACPAINCKAVLNYDACRLMIPNETLVQWDEFLCMSLIPESQKLYCPFRDCSAMLVNDSGEIIRQIKCLVCNRTFCAECHVPWHSEFTCKEFQKLYARKRGKDDKIVKVLAKKKNWQKCPKCKMYVEKAEGCVHITCRCSYEFCYLCGRKWSDSHVKCRPRWISFPGKCKRLKRLLT